MAGRRPTQSWPDSRPWPAAVAIAILLAFTLGLLRIFGLGLADVLRWLLWLVEWRFL